MPNINIRISQEQKDLIEAKALSLGFDSVGAFMKFAATSVKVKVEATMPSPDKLKIKPKPVKPAKTSNESDETEQAVTGDPTPQETDVFNDANSNKTTSITDVNNY